jgi:hypothetical protein
MEPPVFLEAPRSSWSEAPRRLTRPARDGVGEGVELIELRGVWQILPSDPGLDPMPIPGGRQMTVREAVGGRIRESHRYGHWIEIMRETAHAHPELLEWCQRRSNSELKKGGFRFAPRAWRLHAEDALSLPFVPEIDEEDETLRRLAGVERRRRETAARLEELRETRAELVVEASRKGHSRRRLAEFLGVSFGRIQQLVAERR